MPEARTKRSRVRHQCPIRAVFRTPHVTNDANASCITADDPQSAFERHCSMQSASRKMIAADCATADTTAVAENVIAHSTHGGCRIHNRRSVQNVCLTESARRIIFGSASWIATASQLDSV